MKPFLQRLKEHIAPTLVVIGLVSVFALAAYWILQMTALLDRVDHIEYFLSHVGK